MHLICDEPCAGKTPKTSAHVVREPPMRWKTRSTNERRNPRGPNQGGICCCGCCWCTSTTRMLFIKLTKYYVCMCMLYFNELQACACAVNCCAMSLRCSAGAMDMRRAARGLFAVCCMHMCDVIVCIAVWYAALHLHTHRPLLHKRTMVKVFAFDDDLCARSMCAPRAAPDARLAGIVCTYSLVRVHFTWLMVMLRDAAMQLCRPHTAV